MTSTNSEPVSFAADLAKALKAVFCLLLAIAFLAPFASISPVVMIIIAFAVLISAAICVFIIFELLFVGDLFNKSTKKFDSAV